MVKTFYLMRHGQTRFNVQGRIQGACDSPLTDEGIEQAKAARRYFEQEGISFTRVYSSTQESGAIMQFYLHATKNPPAPKKTSSKLCDFQNNL